MDRNLFRRVEIAFPVEAPELQARVATELDLYLSDDMQSWELHADGSYSRVTGTARLCAQTRLLELYDDRGGALTDA